MAILSVGTSLPAGMDPMADKVFSNQVTSWFRTDKTEDYKHIEIEVEYGAREGNKPKPRAKVKLKYAMDGWYMFAVYGDNPHLQSMDRDEWNALAAHALEKFAGERGMRVKLGPRPEDHNRYNWMVEFDKAVEMKEETVQLMAEQAAARAEEQRVREERRRLGIDTGPDYGHYRPAGNPFIA